MTEASATPEDKVQSTPVAPLFSAQTPSVLDRIKTPDELSPYARWLIYGDPGAGKTKLAATAPSPFIIDTENSTDTLVDWPELAVNCKVVKVEDFNDHDEIVQAFKRNDPAIADRKTIVLDTVSETQRDNLDKIVDVDFARDLQIKATNQNHHVRDAFLPHQQDYKKSTEMMRRLVVSFLDMKFNVIVLAHRLEVEIRSGDAVVGRVIRPDLTPKLAKTMLGVFSVEAYLTYKYDGEGNFTNVLQTRQDSRKIIEAKTRCRYLDTLIEMPTWDKIWAGYETSRFELLKYKSEHKPQGGQK
jgi:phage nucleotide-binding protein